ncbi:MAG: DUF4032 domain-containing protein [Anaerolineae bacterium]|nr:DUF4032 domain-containing protein [Anaerolineae bacterium]
MDSREHYPIARARQDFLKATNEGRLRRLWARLTGKNIDLIPFEKLSESIGLHGQSYRGLRPVPLDKIVGSLGRSQDFDRAFLPTQKHSRGKWVSVDSAFITGVTLPPVSLYKVGDAYFVVDGHHRVSVARRQGQAFIDAEVVEVQSRVPVSADLTVDDLDLVAAHRRFLEETKLDELRPSYDLELTMPGDYVKILEHIRVHRYFVGRDEGVDLAWEEAVARWYDNVYLPVYRTIMEDDLLKDFPGHTAGDLYLWIVEHAYYLSQEIGQTIPVWQAAKDYVKRFGRQPNRLWSRIRRRLVDILIPDGLAPGPPAGTWREERVEFREQEQLFRDILVTVAGTETGWLALDQAAEIARLEDSILRGLHVAPSRGEEDVARSREILDEFMRRCQSLGVRATSSIAYGDVADEIIERARWADLVVINQRRIHGQWAERPLGTIFQNVAAQAARPILAVPGTRSTPLKRAVLAYDGSPKAREALFVFRHVLTQWGVEGLILSVESSESDREMLDAAWQYVQADGVTVRTRYETGAPVDVILKVMGEEDANLLLMGGSGHQPLLRAFLGSSVDGVLRVAWFPMLICR